MEASSLSPLPVASVTWQPGPRAWMLTVVCKATFELRPMESLLAPDQEPINHADRHWNDDPGWSVYAPSDIVPLRPRADIVIVGHAFAPGGKPVRSLLARIIVGDLDKAIKVHADRTFTQEGALQEGARFTRMPLLWERTGGGPDTTNPVGVAHDARDMYGKRKLPNLQPPGVVVSAPDDFIEPIGFGPIAHTWPSRRQKLTGHLGAWSAAEWYKKPLPPDLDASYFNSAPRDQQVTALRDNERIILDNLHPEHPHLVTSLPGVHPRAFAQRPGAAPQDVVMRPDLLWINTDRGICTMTWRGQVALQDQREPGVVLVALEGPGQTLGWADVERLAARAGQQHSDRQPILVDAGPEEITATLPPGEDVDDGAATRSAGLEVREASTILPFTAALAAGPPAPPPDPAQRLSATPFVPAGAPAVPPRPATTPPPPSVGPRAPTVPPSVPRPPPPPLRVAPRPAVMTTTAVPPPAPVPPSILAASNAAAGLGAAPAPSPKEPPPASSAAPPVQPASKPGPAAQDVLDLVWYDTPSVPRMRRQPPWRELLKELAKKPIDKQLDDPGHGKDPMEVEDRRDIFEILARAGAIDAPGVREALADAVRDQGKFVPPLRLLAGELSFPFDEVETLKTTIAVVTPFLGNDEALKSSVAAAQEVQRAVDLLRAPAAAEGLTGRIREAWAQGKRPTPAGYLESQSERALLAERHYQRRRVFGGRSLRALLQPAGSEELIPTYLPEALADTLPLAARFKVRLVAELHLPVDAVEAHPAALRVLAIARAAPLFTKGR